MIVTTVSFFHFGTAEEPICRWAACAAWSCPCGRGGARRIMRLRPCALTCALAPEDTAKTLLVDWNIQPKAVPDMWIMGSSAPFNASIGQSLAHTEISLRRDFFILIIFRFQALIISVGVRLRSPGASRGSPGCMKHAAKTPSWRGTGFSGWGLWDDLDWKFQLPRNLFIKDKMVMANDQGCWNWLIFANQPHRKKLPKSKASAECEACRGASQK